MSYTAVVASLKYFHSSYNICVILLFLYQGLLGLKIRKEGKTDKPLKTKIIRRHRKNGPIFAFMGILGYFAGVTIVYLEFGYLWVYPIHLITGSAIVLSVITTSLISKRIKGRDSPWRTPHFILGITIICLYFIQAFLGLRILFLSD